MEIAVLVNALPALAPIALRLMTNRKPEPVAEYLALLRDAATLRLTDTHAETFRRRFNGFYGVRRNAAWRSHFYDLFEAAKECAADPALIFRQVLLSLHDRTGRIEASFASKLVATLHPNAPVIDSVIRAFLAPRASAPPFGGSLDGAVDYYDWLVDLMTELSASEAAVAWGRMFDDSFAHIAGADDIHSVKKLDFLIWGGAAR